MEVEAELANCKRKRRYGNESEARRAAEQQMRMDLGAPDLHVYHCMWCHGWHLTRRQNLLGI